MLHQERLSLSFYSIPLNPDFHSNFHFQSNSWMQVGLIVLGEIQKMPKDSIHFLEHPP